MNATEIIDPILSPLHNILGLVQFIIGGIFGIYLIILIYNWYQSKKLYGQIAGMRKDLDEIKAMLKKGKVKKR